MFSDGELSEYWEKEGSAELCNVISQAALPSSLKLYHEDCKLVRPTPAAVAEFSRSSAERGLERFTAPACGQTLLTEALF